ncbi:MAG: heavy metal translocating P-type ATPase, partial [Pseudomonadota bacterium]
RPFFRSAAASLRAGRFNMDVPIALAVVLAAAVSLGETALGNAHAYFDASVSLLFFLLLGRVLDHQMRVRARTAASQLLARMARAVTVRTPDGATTYRPIEDVAVGETILLSAGEHVPLDGVVIEGNGAVDASVATGEAEPVSVGPNDAVLSGMVNAAGPLALRVTATARDSFLARMIAMMERAEVGRAGYERLADRIARLYAPAVHILALVTFIGWIALGQGWHPAMMAAVATLIITCPCALGLAVPVVQVVASDILFREGVMVKDAAALETLAGADAAVFDKTGTLTVGRMELAEPASDAALAMAAGLARASTHPVSRALVRIAKAQGVAPVDPSDIRETAGYGIEGFVDGTRVRLGRADWVGALEDANETRPTVFLAFDETLARFTLSDTPREGASEAASALADAGLSCEILSGDREAPVAALARRVRVAHWTSRCRPADKVARIEALKAEGRRVLFVGDGLNDGPALRAADVAMAPASAADIGRAAADIVFLREDLRAVPRAVMVAKAAMRLVKQNVALAIAYNAVAVPLAMTGQVTPLVAALAMSGSSILVTANALRLRWSMRRRSAAAPDGTAEAARTVAAVPRPVT